MKKTLKETTLEKIKTDGLKPKPKSYFQIIKVFTYGLSVLLSLLTISIFNLMFYLPGRGQRLIAYPRILDRLSLIPWPLLLIGSALIGLLIYLYRHYEGGYKKHIAIVALVLAALMIFLGAALSASHLNERLERGPRFQRFYQWNDDNFVPRGPRHNQRTPYLPSSYRNL